MYRNLMMFWNFLLALYIVYADVIREDGYHNYEGQFSVENKGRMLRVLMSFRNVVIEECALHCVRHLRCRTFNYRHGKKDCELTDEDFYEMDADTITHGWYNYGTPKRVNGGWSSWRNYTECTETCGDGTLDQYRECDSPRPAHGGADCYGKMTRRVKCYIRGCPVDGGWSNWINSTNCTKPCGSGTLKQRRECNSPKPANGGAGCDGKDTRTVNCNTRACPVVNVALGKVATQSSTHDDEAQYLPSKAVDGDTQTFAYTKYDNNAWLEVNLGAVKVIKKITLNADTYYATNKWTNRGLSIKTRKGAGDIWSFCHNIGDVTKTINKFECEKQSTEAQFLRIHSTKSCYLKIYEVEIFGY